MVPLKKYTPLIFLNYVRIFPPTGAENRKGLEMGMCPFASLKEKSKTLSFFLSHPPGTTYYRGLIFNNKKGHA